MKHPGYREGVTAGRGRRGGITRARALSGLAVFAAAWTGGGCGDPDVSRPGDAGAGDRDASVLSCEPPMETCGGSCVSIATDPLHCGGCERECPVGSFCSSGGCARACSSGLMACGASCVDLGTDRSHCGGCDRSCASDRDCRGGACRCPDGHSECLGTCVNADTDPSHCGICGRACAADEICSRGSCVCAGGSRESECNDTKDNDCDGRIDCGDPDCVGVTRPCSGACGPGTETCGPSGSYGACEGGNGTAEICGDGIDQDCSGADLRNADAFEPNDACAECFLVDGVDPDAVITARFDSVNDPEDCFRFQGDDGVGYPERIDLMLENIPSGHDYDLYLYQSQVDCEARMPLASSSEPGNASETINWTERFATTDDGTYYVRVVRFAGHSCADDYRLILSGLK